MTSGTLTFAAVDGGQSGVRVAVRGSFGTLMGNGPGFSYQHGQDDIERIVAAIRIATPDLPAETRVDRLCAGLTGIPGEPVQQTRLRTALARQFGGPEVAMSADVLLAHAGALAGPGVVICGGTGISVLALAASGEHVTLDSWGPWIGDRGSGWSIGHAGLRAAAAAYDGVGPTTTLCEAFTRYVGGTDLASIQRFYRRPAPTAAVAGFAVQVAQAARDGDVVANAIWERAAHTMAVTAISAARRAGLSGEHSRASWAGRLFQASELLVAPLRAELSKAGIELVPPLSGALEGGLALLSAGLHPAYIGLLRQAVDRHPPEPIWSKN